jgi:uncharacterized protein involved in type VI secretion and phage assembly
MSFVSTLMERGLEFFKRYYGVYVGQVVDNEDPQNQDRVRLRVPMLGLPTGKDTLPNWARPVQLGPFTPGNNKGSTFVPRVGDWVNVTFENGNSSTPQYSTGGWYAKGEKPAEFATVEDRGWKTHSGHIVRFRDEGEAEEILIQHTAGGKIEFTVDNTITVETNAGDKVVIDPTGNVLVQHRSGTKMELDDSSATIEAVLLATIRAQQVVLEASQTKLSAKGAVHPVVKGDVILQYLQTLHAWLLLYVASHQHVTTTPSLPTTPFVPPALPPVPPPTMLSVKTKTG